MVRHERVLDTRILGDDTRRSAFEPVQGKFMRRRLDYFATCVDRSLLNATASFRCRRAVFGQINSSMLNVGLLRLYQLLNGSTRYSHLSAASILPASPAYSKNH
jgi:hypothetical protein